MTTDDHIDAMRLGIERDLQLKIGISEDRIQWAAACLKECQGITREALEKGVITFALDWLLKHDILDVFDPNMPRKEEIPKEEATFMGVRIWDPES